MRHRKSGKQLSRTSSHRKAMLGNLVTSLITHERVETTHVKAKQAQRVADKMVTFAKEGTLHARRQSARVLKHPAAVQKLFNELGPRYQDRAGGYTRVLDLRVRKGDGAEVALLEFIPAPGQTHLPSEAEGAKAEKKGRKGLLSRRKKADAPKGPKPGETGKHPAKKGRGDGLAG